VQKGKREREDSVHVKDKCDKINKMISNMMGANFGEVSININEPCIK
jgi:hypothetical protein